MFVDCKTDLSDQMGSNKKNNDIMKLDLYKLFDVGEDATTKKVKAS